MGWWIRASFILAAALGVFASLFGGEYWPTVLLVAIVGIPAFVAALGSFAVVQRLGMLFGYSGAWIVYLGLALGVFGAAPLAGGLAFYLAAKVY